MLTAPENYKNHQRSKELEDYGINAITPLFEMVSFREASDMISC